MTNVRKLTNYIAKLQQLFESNKKFLNPRSLERKLNLFKVSSVSVVSSSSSTLTDAPKVVVDEGLTYQKIVAEFDGKEN